MKRCIILAGGPPDDCETVALQAEKEDLIIACDAGYAAAQKFGVCPALAVGDFDSYDGPVTGGTQRVRVPAEKDDTDTLLGVKIGLERGFDTFLIVGAFGGRLDHTIANLQLLGFLCDHGARGEIRSDKNCAWAVRDGVLTLPRMEGFHLSVFAWGGVCTGVTLRGLKYSLTNAVLTPQISLGVSNEFSAEQAEISVQKGTLLVVASYENLGGCHDE